MSLRASHALPLARRLSAVTATLTVVASMVGVGVFTTSGFLLRDLGSPGAVVLVWLVGGLLALSGALCYAELASALPYNGGEYQLLGRIYQPWVGFVAGWVSFIVGFSAPTAAAAMACASYLRALAPNLPHLPIALGIVLVPALLHALRVSWGSAFQNAATAAQAVLVLVFVGAGLLLGSPQQAAQQAASLAAAVLSPAFAVGLVYVSFSYSGWNAAVYIAGELCEPERALPRALVTGTLLVTALYVGLNLVFTSAAPAAVLAGKLEVAHVAAQYLFGLKLARVLDAVIALGLWTSVSALLLTGPRVYEAMGADYPALRFICGRTGSRGPVRAIALQAGVASLLAVTASFEQLLRYAGFMLAGFAGLTALGVFVLRVREPALRRPYSTWGYPLTPAAFALLNLWMISHTMLERPGTALAGLATVLSGLALYGLARRY